MTAKNTLSINFYATNITDELKIEFMQAIKYESASMTIQLLNDDIQRLKKRVVSLKEDIAKNGDDESYTKQKKIDYIVITINDKKTDIEKLEKIQLELVDSYNKVIAAMTEKNVNHFGNSKDVVCTIFRVLATLNNSKLVKYAIIPAFESSVLYEALETININSRANEDGDIIMSKEVKEAYKKASQELETIIKTTFSLPFDTPYTNKTRVKLTAEDKKLLNDCYVKGFTNKFNTDSNGIITFKKRTINTLVKVTKNRKTGEIKYNYSGLASTIANIVIKHYFV